MKPIVISYPENVERESAAVNALFEAGLEVLHVRKPGMSEPEMKAWVETIDQKYHNRLVLHGHLSLVESMQLRGVHFTTYNRHLIDNYNNLDIPKSISVHSMTELVHLGDSFEYALLSPVFESISKEGYGPAVDQAILKPYLANIHNVKVCALGGIDGTTVDDAKDMGFDGIALHGALWAQFEKDGDVDGLVKRFVEIAKKW